MFVELHEERDLASLLERSQKDPVVLFKHSTQCSRSAEAYEELQEFMSRHPAVACGLILVIEDRALSDQLEDQFGIRHESPQAFVVFRGSAVWHAHHWKVTADALEEAISQESIRA